MNLLSSFINEFTDLTRQQSGVDISMRDVEQTMKRLEGSFSKHYDHARQATALLSLDVSKIESVNEYTNQIGALYLLWRGYTEFAAGMNSKSHIRTLVSSKITEAPALPALVMSMLDVLGADIDGRLAKIALAASILGDIPNAENFHNNAHYRDITSTIFRLITCADQLKETKIQLDLDDKILMLIAACIHDYAHDGQGNMHGGIHLPMRLERKALDYSLPILKLFGLRDDEQARLETMILCTDVSCGPQGLSPSRILSKVYNFHYNHWPNPKIKSLEYAPLYQALMADEKTCLMAMMLEEADIFTSVGLSYDYAKLTTILVAKETKILSTKASTLLGFIEIICDGLIASPAACHLFSEGFEEIYIQVGKDVMDDIDFALSA